MDEKLTKTIGKIELLCKQNSEFDAELRKRLGVTSAQIATGNNLVEEIYEYCIETVVKRHAMEFYSDFPIASIVDNLIGDFCRMETFYRKDCFGDFCLALYQQIECITNKVCTNSDLEEITRNMWGIPAYIKTGEGIEPKMENRSGKYQIASLLFGKYAAEKSKQSIQAMYAKDKMRVVVYFLGFKAAMKNSDYDCFVGINNLLSDIYQCRNTNHRGNVLQPWESEILNRVLSVKALYYLKFYGALSLFVEMVKNGWGELSTIKSYSRTVQPIPVKIGGPNVCGKINLVDDGKRRFK